MKGALNIPTRIEQQPADLIRGLLTRQVADRLDLNSCMHHAFFEHTDWSKVLRKEYPAPVIPTIDEHREESGVHDQEELLIFRSPASSSGDGTPRSRPRVVSWRAESRV